MCYNHLVRPLSTEAVTGTGQAMVLANSQFAVGLNGFYGSFHSLNLLKFRY
jgi:hypothetical protein